MSVLQRLRQPWSILGLGCLVLLCVISIENQHFTDQLSGKLYHRTQTIWMVLGFIGAGLVASLDVAFLRRVSPLAYQTVVVLLVAVLVVGREINYSKRWLELGPVNLQPSEFMKIAVILMLADHFDRRRATAPSKLMQLVVPVLYMMVPVVLINMGPDLGTSLVVAFIAASVIAYDGIHKRTLLAGALLVVVSVPFAWKYGVIRDYQKGRVESWRNLVIDEDLNAPRKRTAQSSQAEQAVWAVGSGRFTGKTDSEAKASVLRHLPFLHTDFALAAYAERYGMLGCLFLFSLYMGVVAWALHLADRAHERFDALCAVGIAALIFWQFFINAGMVIGLLPVVGITLPLVSYGGSSALTVLLGCGVLLNIATRRKAR